MGYPDNCARCGESYDSDNLMTCRGCGSDVCYRCFGSAPRQCSRCSPKLPSQPPASATALLGNGGDTGKP